MKRQWVIIAAAIILCPILFVLGVILFQKPSLSLIVNGKVVAVVRQPFFRPNWSYGSADVYAGGKKIFSLPENYLLDGGPIFIYPFADGKRFLCDYDDDTSLLDFVVDFRDSATNEPRSSGWPPNDNSMGDRIGLGNYVRTYMASRITNVVFDTQGIIRLPTYAELQEVSSYLTNTTPSPIKAVYFQLITSGTKKGLLLDLATDRQSVWPMAK
jgi:hypothetical protein